MAGSYIDPCGSGAFEGSGSWDTGSTGSWSGSGSGNDQLTGSNCCSSPPSNLVCCMPGKLKMKLFVLHLQDYTDPQIGNVRWYEIEESQTYTLSKTIYCDDTGGSEERWVIENPDVFSSFGNLEGLYVYDSGIPTANAYFSRYSTTLILNNSINISLKTFCKCETSYVNVSRGPAIIAPAVNNQSLQSCASCFLAVSYAEVNSFYPWSLSRTLHAMIWVENTDLEKCYGIHESVPNYIYATKQTAGPACGSNNLYYGMYNFTNSGQFNYRRVAIPSGSSTIYAPFYIYADCRFPAKQGYPGVPQNTDQRRALRESYLKYDWSNLSCANIQSAQNNTISNRTYLGTWSILGSNLPQIFYQSFPSNSFSCKISGMPSSCESYPKSINPIYDIVYPNVYDKNVIGLSGIPNCIGSGYVANPLCDTQPNPDKYVLFYTESSRYILTEGTECPPYTYSGSLPGSGSTPVSGSAPTSGSTPGSGSGSGSGSAPVTCYGGCAYNITSYVSGGDGYGWNWILTGTYAGNVCSTGCGCSNTGTITFSYWGPEGGWPNPLYFPCDPGAGGGSGGSSGSGSGSSSGSGSGSSSGSGSTSGGSTSSSGSGFIMVPF